MKQKELTMAKADKKKMSRLIVSYKILLKLLYLLRVSHWAYVK